MEIVNSFRIFKWCLWFEVVWEVLSVFFVKGRRCLSSVCRKVGFSYLNDIEIFIS